MGADSISPRWHRKPRGLQLIKNRGALVLQANATLEAGALISSRGPEKDQLSWSGPFCPDRVCRWQVCQRQLQISTCTWEPGARADSSPCGGSRRGVRLGSARSLSAATAPGSFCAGAESQAEMSAPRFTTGARREAGDRLLLGRRAHTLWRPPPVPGVKGTQ